VRNGLALRVEMEDDGNPRRIHVERGQLGEIETVVQRGDERQVEALQDGIAEKVDMRWMMSKLVGALRDASAA